MAEDSDDDLPQLSAHTMQALQEFYKEQEELNKQTTENDSKLVFEENWQLSQFWYDESTVQNMIKGAIAAAGDNGRIALISCPTLYNEMKKQAIGCEVTLFEYDQRFAAFGNDFQFYNYESPLDIPRNLARTFDVVLADPPFLSDECLTKTAVTIKFLTKDKIVLCTGAVMSELAQRLLRLKKCKFEPRHKNNLANEFWCYSNFDFDALINA